MERCYSCFAENEDGYTVCRKCGCQRITEPKEGVDLWPGTVLKERYVIGQLIDAGGFGRVYKAWDTKMGRILAIKEFYPSSQVSRAIGMKEIEVNIKEREEYLFEKKRFVMEAKYMAKFSDHPNMTCVYEYFEENNTAYIVMEYLEGHTLAEYVKEEGTLDIPFAKYIVKETASILTELHKANIIHRDVAPDNIFICDKNVIRVKLMDLGAAKLADEKEELKYLVRKAGYSPTEQYSEGNVGPWMDVYALGATLYYMLTGVVPDESTNRSIDKKNKGGENRKDPLHPPRIYNEAIPESLNNAIMNAMEVDWNMRYKSIPEFMKAVEGEKVPSPDQRRRRKRMRWITAIVSACLAVTMGAAACVHIYNSKKSEDMLVPAAISVWFSGEADSDEYKAMASVKENFEQAYPGVVLEMKGFPEQEYAAELRAAAEAESLPDLFESSGVSGDILDQCRELTPVLKTPQFEKCLFLDQYDSFYKERKQLPLAIEVPMACVITSGAAHTDYSGTYFSGPDSFGAGVNISGDSRYSELVQANFGPGPYSSETEFFEPEHNTSPVLLTSTMALNQIRETLINYKKIYVFPDEDPIYCSFIYEWSIAAEDGPKLEAAQRLLSWMLGNVYQTTLMITECSDGQIPLNPLCFQAKLESRNLKPVAGIYENFVFERGDGGQ